MKQPLAPGSTLGSASGHLQPVLLLETGHRDAVALWKASIQGRDNISAQTSMGI